MRKALDEGFLEATDVAEYLVLKGIPSGRYQAAKPWCSVAWPRTKD
jgi:hypothetical protein